jgi:hypothetical protein
MTVPAIAAEKHIAPDRDEVEDAQLMATSRTDRPPFDPLFIAGYTIGEDADETPHEGAGYEADGKIEHLGNNAQQTCHKRSILSTLLHTL